ncbi:hypothetical protein BST61_g9894 [Cercospora zeina]
MFCSQLLHLSLLAFATLGQAGALPSSTTRDLNAENDVIKTFDIPQVDANENKQLRIPSGEDDNDVRYEDLDPAEPAVTSLPDIEMDKVILRPIVHVTSLSTIVRKREAVPTNPPMVNP